MNLYAIDGQEVGLFKRDGPGIDNDKMNIPSYDMQSRSIEPGCQRTVSWSVN